MNDRQMIAMNEATAMILKLAIENLDLKKASVEHRKCKNCKRWVVVDGERVCEEHCWRSRPEDFCSLYEGKADA